MPQPPAAPAAKKKRQRMIIIGAAGAALLLLLYIRSRSSSSTNATSSTDAQTAAQNAAAQQAAIDAQNASSTAATPSTFADNGSNAASLADSVTSGLAGVQDALTQLQSGQQSAAAVQDPSVNPTATPPITINNYGTGQPAGKSSGASPGVRMSTGVPRGALAAPFGHSKPAAPKGYTAVGLGGGNWAFKPVATKSTQSKSKQKKK